MMGMHTVTRTTFSTTFIRPWFGGRRVLALIMLCWLPAVVSAADAPVVADHQWSFEGAFGVFDRTALQRGFQVYREVCSACHGIRHVSYRDLAALGYDSDDIKAIASEYDVLDGPNGEGDMFERPALPSDKFVSPFPNHNAARAANNGSFPPDLSLIVKARQSGDDYLYALLTGYGEPPGDFNLPEGRYYNTAFPGFQIAMPPPFEDGLIEYADGTPATISQMASDVTTFLAWTAEPELEDRKKLGVKVLIFLVLLTAMLLAVKRKIWKNIDDA